MVKNVLKFVSCIGLVLIAAYAYSTTANEGTVVTVDHVYDGDTIYIKIPKHPTQLQMMGIRIYGIDTPEEPSVDYANTGKLGRAKCVKEAEQALKAKAYLEHLVIAAGNKITLFDIQPDKYGGRFIARVRVGNVDVAEQMLSAGFAIPYFGEAKTHNWCE